MVRLREEAGHGSAAPPSHAIQTKDSSAFSVTGEISESSKIYQAKDLIQLVKILSSSKRF